MVVVPLAIDSSIPWQLVLFVAISDIGFARVNGIGGSCYQAVGRPMGTLRLSVGFATARVMAAFLWVAVARHHDALSWSHYYFAISMLAAVVSVWRVRRELGPPHWQIAWHEWRDGFHFALQTASQSAFGSTDKPVIAALSDLSVAGVYAAASRIVAAAGIPVSALLYSAYVRFFQVGVAGPRASARLAVRLLPVGVGLGALGTVAILVLAPLAPRVLGHSYIGTDAALLLLAPLPVFRAVYSLGLDVLVSTGHTGLRTVAQIAMPPVNILLCCLLVPSHGVIGAAIAALLTHVSLAIGSVDDRRSARPATIDAGPCIYRSWKGGQWNVGQLIEECVSVMAGTTQKYHLRNPANLASVDYAAALLTLPLGEMKGQSIAGQDEPLANHQRR